MKGGSQFLCISALLIRGQNPASLLELELSMLRWNSPSCHSDPSDHQSLWQAAKAVCLSGPGSFSVLGVCVLASDRGDTESNCTLVAAAQDRESALKFSALLPCSQLVLCMLFCSSLEVSE